MREELKVSELPLLTFRWLKCNDSQVSYDIPEETGLEASESIIDRPFGLSDEILEYNKRARTENIDLVFERGEEEDKFIYFNLDDKGISNEEVQIFAKEGARANVLLDFHSNKKAVHNGVLKIKAEKNSLVNLAYVQRLNNESKHLYSIVSQVEEGAEVNISQIEFGSGQAFSNYKAYLEGENSSTEVECAYLASGTEHMDLFYNIIHEGKNSISDINLNGCLKDESSKTFKGTIDFKEGCSGSEGSEHENVTLLGDRTHHISLPILLCHEEDVKGNHSASAGQLDEDVLFYIMSRGFSEEEANTLIIEASMTKALDEIKDRDLKDQVLGILEEKMAWR